MSNPGRTVKHYFFSLFILALLSYPFLSIADKATFFLGWPISYLYLFVIWIVAIIAQYFLIHRQDSSKNE
ncbi:MAG TPA: hypothetical protein PK006_08620 [Saprospiraceae bacterium]|nr:hypothetical protein [Saprospiraceae bacterium]